MSPPRSGSPRRRERQPGDRVPAPGELGLVQAFVNTRWNLEREHRDQLGSPSDLAGWLAQRALLDPGVVLTPADLARALDVREGLRALLFVNNGAPVDESVIQRLNRALDRAQLVVRISPAASPLFETPRRDFNGALAMIAGIVAVAQIDGGWRRLKACRGLHCGWAFYDNSRNQSGSWCSMSVCGSRAKARAYRRRKR